MTKAQLINYCNERIEGFHIAFRKADRAIDRVHYEAKASSYRDIVVRLGGTPRIPAPKPNPYYEICGADVRGGGTCLLNKGHRGYHSTVVFECDGCGRPKRGKPFKTERDGEYPDAIQYCYTCVVRSGRY